MRSPKILILIWVLYLTPLAINLGNVGEKPIDLALSDLLVAFLPVMFLGWGALPYAHWNALALLSYFVFLGLIGAVAAGGDVGNLLSAFTFSMPFLHLLVGGLLMGRWGFGALTPAPLVLSAVIFALFASDLVLGSFPRGCGTEGRWGGCMFAWDVYGFVNSSAGYLAVMAGLLVSSLFVIDRRISRYIVLSSLGILVFIIPMSLSRSATLTLVIILFFGLFSINKTVAVIGSLFSALSLQFVLPALENTLISRGLVSRIYAGIDRGDVVSGRFDIWYETISLAAEAPLFGYKFGYFSDFSFFGTAHNQYLEVLFKSGLMGVLVYFGFMAYVFLRARKVFKEIGLDPRVRITALGSAVALLACSFSQPLMNYAVMGNLIFLFAGMMMAVPLRGQHEANPQRPRHPQDLTR